MATQAATTRTVRFGVFEFDSRAGELRKQGMKIKLQGQPIEILALLLEHPGEVVTREELQRKLWPADTFVDFEHSLNAAVKRLRDALDDSADTPRYVETLARRGYRFIASVSSSGAPRSYRWLWAPAGGVVFLLAAALVLNPGGWRNRFLGRGGPAKKITLAVLPFENLSNDSEQEYFSDGMTDELITQLGRLQPDRLGVIARGSVMRYKHSDQASGRVAQELGVQYILEGSVRREGQKVRISAQLIQTSDQTHLWAQNYDGDLSGILALQSKVARDAANEIRVKLTPKANAAGPAARSVDPEAYQLYLRGRYDLNRILYKGGTERLKTAMGFFNQSVEKDPLYAPAYAGLAEAYSWAGDFDSAHAAANYAEGRKAAEKAFQLDDSLAAAHLAIAGILESQWEFSAAEKEARLATELDPNSAYAHQGYALLLMHLGRIEDSWAQMHLAATLDPQSSAFLVYLGHYYVAARQWDKAIETGEAAVKSDPDFLFSYNTLAPAYEQKGMFDKALQAYVAGALKWGADPAEMNRWAAPLRRAYETGGARAYWKKFMQVELAAAKRDVGKNPVEVAMYCAQAGEVDQAFAWLEKAYREHSNELTQLKLMPYFDTLHSDPRYTDLLRRVGFPQ